MDTYFKKRFLFIWSLLFPVFLIGQEIHLTSGFKVMEVTEKSAILWTRTYAQAKPNPIRHQREDKVFRHPIDFNEQMSRNDLDGGVPGIPGFVLFRITNGKSVKESDWIPTNEETGFIAAWAFKKLKPATAYEVKVFAKNITDGIIRTFTGSFVTAPKPSKSTPISLTTSTCQYFWSYDDPDEGFKTYLSMAKMKPDFFVQTGDYVYYDKPGPLAKDLNTARHKWHAMDSWPSLRSFHRNTPMYMIKDDHDLLKDDVSDPNSSYGSLSYQDGLKVWYENVRLHDKPYRTVRWGKDLQIWLVEGREYRSLNQMEDGPEKTIWGAEQKEWFEQTLQKSKATFKIVFSATPIVGPDRKNKADNHSNETFRNEGEWLRKLLSGLDNLFVITGDRHWQYYSIDGATGVHEFGSGPVSDAHAQGWNPEDKRPQHQFLRVKGGFLGIKVFRDGKEPRIEFTHYDVDGGITNQVSFSNDQ